MCSRKGLKMSDLTLQVRRAGITAEIILRNIKIVAYNDRSKSEAQVCKALEKNKAHPLLQLAT
jgi:hypothetical protein